MIEWFGTVCLLLTATEALPTTLADSDPAHVLQPTQLSVGISAVLEVGRAPHEAPPLLPMEDQLDLHGVYVYWPLLVLGIALLGLVCSASSADASEATCPAPAVSQEKGSVISQEELACSDSAGGVDGGGQGCDESSAVKRAALPFDGELIVRILDRLGTTQGADVAIRMLGAEGSAVTYAELLASARLLASSLRAAGLSSSQLVGVLIERSPLAIISAVGVVIAGGAYVPLDPSYPKARLLLLVDAAKLRLVVCVPSSPLAKMIGSERPAVALVATSVAPASTPAQPVVIQPQTEEAGGRLLYVLFTSGSTGKPKVR